MAMRASGGKRGLSRALLSPARSSPHDRPRQELPRRVGLLSFRVFAESTALLGAWAVTPRAPARDLSEGHTLAKSPLS